MAGTNLRHNLAHLHIEPLLIRLAHREGLAGECTVHNDGTEERRLVNRGAEEAHIVLLPCEGGGGIDAVDVIDLRALVVGQVGVQELLQRGRLKILGGFCHGHDPRPCRSCIRQFMGFRSGPFRGLDGVLHGPARLCGEGDAPGGKPVLHALEQVVRGGVEDHTVDALELQPRVVDVDQLHEGVPRRVVHDGLLVLGLLLRLLPVQLGCSKGVVAIPHGVQQDLVLVRDGDVVLLGVDLGVRQSRDRRCNLLNLVLLIHSVASQMAPIAHQVEVVHLLQLLVEQGLDHGAVRVIDEDHDMGQLHRGRLPYLDTRRQTGQDGPLGRTHQGGGALLVAVVLQVQRHHEALAGGHHSRLPIQQHEAGLLLDQDVSLHVLCHLGFHTFNHGTFFGGLQKDFRKDHVVC
mmetsp:Transcript_5961/g.11056  ORF Transcript_5961/g.11056 Transcript_5961/m.11056 type:complete len:404 (-) Transcript_5961:351-1562(-)